MKAVLGIAVLGLAASAACKGKGESTEATPTHDAGLDAALGDLEAGFGDAAATCRRCAQDFHSFLDCEGNAVETCPAGQACTQAGTCAPACDAVEAAKGSLGCTFVPHHPEAYTNLYDCYAVFVANTWDTPVTLSATAGGVPVDVTSFAYLPRGTGPSITYEPLPDGQIPPGDVAIVFLHQNDRASVSCPMPPASGSAPPEWNDVFSATGKSGHALKLQTSAPVAMYDIYPYGGGRSQITGATLLLPTSAWGDNYVVITPYPHGENTTPPAVSVVAAEDDTDVTLVPTVSIVGGGGVAPAPGNVPVTYTLEAGEILHISQDQDLLGSILSSSKPVGLWATQTCITVRDLTCDSAHQQIPPISALGSEYVGVRYRNREDGVEESPPWRLVGLVDDTKLSWAPAPPADVPTTLDRGTAVTFATGQPFVVRSQDKDHPFYLNAYMTGGAPHAARGDAEFVNVIPAGQYLDRYVFFTDPTYPETNLVFVRPKVQGNFQDVWLDCAGYVSGWQPVGAYEYARVDLSRHDFEPQSYGFIPPCDNGRHEAKSNGPFGLTVWGWGTDESGPYGSAGYSQGVSYAYPGGAGVQAINAVVVPSVPR